MRWLVVASVLALAPLALVPSAWADERVVVRVMFGVGSAELDGAAVEVVEAAAPRARACEHNGVRVVGHTDTALASEASDELGKARGRVVRDALVARGVAGSAISAVGHGENELAVATKDGVSEPRNNRAEIILVCD